MLQTKLQKKKTSLTILLHTGIWLLLFSLPLVLNQSSSVSLEQIARMNWTSLFFACVIFYMNYFYLTDLLIVNKKTVCFILLNILVLLNFALMNHLIIEWNHYGSIFRISPSLPPPDMDFKEPHFVIEGRKPGRELLILGNFGSFLIPVFISLAMKVFVRNKTIENEKKEMQHQNVLAELAHLKYQLQPHFFFNSLNNIYALIDISQEKSKDAIHKLAKLIRYLLYETNIEKVELREEVNFLHQYIHLMQLRLTEKTKIETDFPLQLPNINIAPLLFLPLVENAFKHGVSANKETRIFMQLLTDEHSVEFIVKNNYIETSGAELTEPGIGLENLQKRLKLLYPDNSQFGVNKENGIFTAHLKIILK